MTWFRLQKLVEALLSGDHTLPKDVDMRLVLLQYAFEQVSDDAQAIVLFRDADTDPERVNTRQSLGGRIVRPNLPSRDDEEIDMDEGLVFAVARYMASYISKEKFNLHEAKAKELIKNYNNKVYSYSEQLEGELL